MDIWGFVFVAVIAAVFLLFLRDVIASGVKRGILDAHEIIESEKALNAGDRKRP